MDIFAPLLAIALSTLMCSTLVLLFLNHLFDASLVALRTSAAELYMFSGSTERRHLGPDIRAKIDATAKDKVVDLRKVPEGHVVKIFTQNSTYLVAVVEKEEGLLVAMRGGKHMEEAVLCSARGSRFEGSGMTKVDHVCPGLRFETNPVTGGLFSTSPIRGVVVEDNSDLWQELVGEARENEPTEEFDAVAFEQRLMDFLRKSVTDPDQHQQVMDLLEHFEVNGKVVAISIAITALEHGKFDEAIALLLKEVHEGEWRWVPPFVRANVSTRVKESWIIEGIYRQLGLPLPSSGDPEQS